MIKGVIVNTGFGAHALDVREQAEMRRTLRSNPEAIGFLANDVMARRLLERLCRDGGIFVDVGAHIGSVINGVMRRSRPSQIIAVEAIPEKVAALRRRFPKVDIQSCAVGAQAGEVRFFIDEQRSGFSSLDAEITTRAPGAVRELVVPMRTLDEIVPHQNVDVIKIDVEGAELGVLRGAEAVIAGSRPTIMFESGPGQMDDYSNEAIWSWFDAHDYAIVVPNRVAHRDDGMSLAIFEDSHLYPRRTTNYFGIARERRDEIRARARRLLGFDR